MLMLVAKNYKIHKSRRPAAQYWHKQGKCHRVCAEELDRIPVSESETTRSLLKNSETISQVSESETIRSLLKNSFPGHKPKACHPLYLSFARRSKSSKILIHQNIVVTSLCFAHTGRSGQIEGHKPKASHSALKICPILGHT